MSKEKVFENEFMRLELKDGIVYGMYKTGPITLELAKKVVQHRLEFTENEKMPLLVGEAGLKGIERDARQFLSSEEGSQGISAAAIVTKSVFGSHLANFFMRISAFKPLMPARMFHNEQEAVDWLKTFS